jgi:pilus assembly protein CpaC
MNNKASRMWRSALLGACAGWLLAALPAAHAADVGDMTVPLFKSRIVETTAPVGRVSVGNPDVADIVIIRPTEIYVLGKDLGSTNVLLWGRDNRLVRSLDVEVVHDLEGLKQRYHALLPDQPIEVRAAQRSIVLSGRVRDAEQMSMAVRLAETYLAQVQTAEKAVQFEQESQSTREDKSVGGVINLLQVAGSQQVMLEVKVAEISRTELKRLNAQFNAILSGGHWNFGGVNGGARFPPAVFQPGTELDASGKPVYVPGSESPGGKLPVFGNRAPYGPAIAEFVPNPMQIQNQGLFASYLSAETLFNLALDAARENGVAKILAEPTLTTLTGQEAQFLSGGEFPIPVPQGINGVGIEFKEFGVGLKFVPVVLSDGHINLRIAVSVSELIDANSIAVSQEGVTARFFVPSLTKRSASATVELGDGQTIGIAGLINENLREVVSKFPGLGDLPVLGALFRSQEFQKGQTELVILVTPRLAKPLPEGGVKLPTDGFVEPSDADFFLLGRIEGTRAGAAK